MRNQRTFVLVCRKYCHTSGCNISNKDLNFEGAKRCRWRMSIPGSAVRATKSSRGKNTCARSQMSYFLKTFDFGTHHEQPLAAMTVTNGIDCGNTGWYVLQFAIPGSFRIRTFLGESNQKRIPRTEHRPTLVFYMLFLYMLFFYMLFYLK